MTARTLLLLLLLAAGAPGAARAGDAIEDALRAGIAALDRRDAAAAVASLESARALAPGRADVCFHLARAYEKDGRTADAVAFYAEAARLDKKELSAAARKDAERLRKEWAERGIEAGDEAFKAGRYSAARKEYARAYEVAAGGAPRLAARAREGHARAATAEFVANALVGQEAKGLKVAVLKTLGAPPASALGEVAQIVEEAVVRALRAAGCVVLGPEKKAEAALSIQAWGGQRFALRAEDVAAGGVQLARSLFDALAEAADEGLPPDPIGLELAIEAERDPPGRRGREPRPGDPPPQRLAVGEGAALRTDDRFRIRVRPTREAYVYAFIFDSQGRATLLYPGTERLFKELADAQVLTPNPVPGGRDLLVPPPPPKGKPYWFYLDEHPGTETFYVAASLAALPDVAALTKEIELEGEAGRVAAKNLAAALEKRAGRTRLDESGSGTEAPPAGGHVELIRGRGAVVRHMSVQHLP